ncbi:MAG: hypothetical protein IRD7MM_00470 [Candidatus Midichloria mitochondrii]|nr:hypothetical protein [Candidatus Midichloria mitochondrii]MDJ1288499.1 hypothetical protein [Candidatus Midichloria mitochondrii]MDJ1299329.1 hypothetical protein [Candidatus Midichloria mitochondrii]MDJ1313452.1 hypothetical protein [Candidatus Midichloria mitochondrii]MDJ1584036.1 hypothetical protein [Candidatus Midichloria mitochondrii]
MTANHKTQGGLLSSPREAGNVDNTTIKLKEEAMNNRNKIYSEEDLGELKEKLSYKATEIVTALLGQTK